MERPHDREFGIALLVAERLPLLTPDIQAMASQFDVGSQSPPPSFEAALALVKCDPEHFGDLIYAHTGRHAVDGAVVYTTSEGRVFYDVDIDIVRRYIRAGRFLAYKFRRLPNNRFQEKIKKLLDNKKKYDDAQAGETDNSCSFSIPPSILDCDRLKDWLQYDGWTSDEAIALSLDRDPLLVTYKSILQEVGSRPSRLKIEFERRQRLLERAHLKRPIDSLIEPAVFIAWAFDRDLIASDGSLYSLAKQMRDDKHQKVLNIESKQLKRKFCRMILIMAIDKYRHTLTSNSKAHSAISQQFNDAGFKMTGETVGDTLSDIVNDPIMADDMELIREYEALVNRRARS